MKLLEQRIAIGEESGWRLDDGGIHYRDPDGFYRPTDSMLNFKAGGLPDYPNDLNAMQEALLWQPREFRADFYIALNDESVRRGKLITEMPAADWARVFLTLKGEWTDAK